MLTQIQNRHNTDDIDVLLKDIEDSRTSSLYQTFKTAVQLVARKNQLPSIWLNDMIGDFLRDLGTAPEGRLWHRYDQLEVFLPPKEYILALKLLAGRQKDMRDIQALCQQLRVQTREHAQQLVDRYIPDKQFQQLNNLDKTLSMFF